ncbi:uncharacterized protein EV154DRAFT_581367 [Mucor mucedo]|uniref:uncharacterized protein n=1 Tax=Mucor mucedo TaxID=29922 RepID=UPI00221EBB84|nr:uncharacterized protein EV154DRAFT_581367 [Mucor mucedo]KAI7870064.1 hypothetical protein EV154DRAFT_581367 [Mucor mucedo]
MNSVCQEIIGDMQLPASGVITDNSPVYVGFDIEWRVFDSNRKRFCSLRPGCPLPTQVNQLLESENVIKFGRPVKGDFGHLNGVFDINCRGDQDVLDLCVEKGAVCHKNVSLNYLVQSVLGFRMNKSLDIRLSNWDSI